MNGKAKRILTVLIALSAALCLGGTVWAITQGVKSAKYAKATATVTSCETQDLGGENVTVKVLVSYEAGGVTYENVSYIGDLNRCKTGMRMRVYYLKAAPSEYVYSKSSDLGFALILLGGGVLWSAVTAVYGIAMKRTGYI